MNTEELRAALEADTDGWGEPWRRHVGVLQEYIGELAEALRECEAIRSLPHAYHGDSTISQDVRSEKISSVLREIADAPTLTTNNRQRLQQFAEDLSQNVRSEQQVSTSCADAISRPNSRVRETDFGNTENSKNGGWAATEAAMDAAERGEVDRTLSATLIWQAVFNPPEGMEDYQAYRIEYGGHAMDCVMEGTIWLPPGVDPQTIERILQGEES